MTDRLMQMKPMTRMMVVMKTAVRIITMIDNSGDSNNKYIKKLNLVTTQAPPLADLYFRVIIMGNIGNRQKVTQDKWYRYLKGRGNAILNGTQINGGYKNSFICLRCETDVCLTQKNR